MQAAAATADSLEVGVLVNEPPESEEELKYNGLPGRAGRARTTSPGKPLVHQGTIANTSQCRTLFSFPAPPPPPASASADLPRLLLRTPGLAPAPGTLSFSAAPNPPFPDCALHAYLTLPVAPLPRPLRLRRRRPPAARTARQGPPLVQRARATSRRPSGRPTRGVRPRCSSSPWTADRRRRDRGGNAPPTDDRRGARSRTARSAPPSRPTRAAAAPAAQPLGRARRPPRRPPRPSSGPAPRAPATCACAPRPLTGACSGTTPPPPSPRACRPPPRAGAGAGTPWATARCASTTCRPRPPRWPGSTSSLLPVPALDARRGRRAVEWGTVLAVVAGAAWVLGVSPRGRSGGTGSAGGRRAARGASRSDAWSQNFVAKFRCQNF